MTIFKFSFLQSIIKLFALFNICPVFFPVYSFDYCKIKCGEVQHTMCEYEAGGGPNCEDNAKVYLNTQEKMTILAFHNNRRNDVASGEESRGLFEKGQPQAGNMMKLVWDGELGAFAKRWADQCDRPIHDICRRSLSGEDVGQNSYVGTFLKTDDMDRRLERINRLNHILKKWYGEVDLMNGSDVHEFLPEMEAKVGNYSQMVWGNTIYLGCGYTEFSDSKGNVSFRFICNYMRKGNNANNPIYRTDQPCSSCPRRSKCSTTWTSLCWNEAENEFIDDENHGTTLFPFSFFQNVWYLILVFLRFFLQN